MSTSARCFSPLLMYWGKSTKILLLLTTLCSFSFFTSVHAQGSCTDLFDLDATRTYDPGTNTTTYQFIITKTGAQNSLSHWGFPVELCPGTTGSVQDLLATATEETSIDGQSWSPVSISYGVDPSSSACTSGDVLKFNQSMNEPTRYFRLIFPGNVLFNINVAYIKYGNSCCLFNNILTSTPTLTCPANKTVGACMTQADVNAAFTDWLDDVVYSNGILSTNPTTPAAPPACGGSTTVTWTVTGCSTVTCSATFTVTNAPAVVLTAPANMTVGACQTQAQVDAAFATWLSGVQASGGCNLQVSNGNPSAPSACGGSVEVTWTASSSCEANKTASATFTVTGAPAVQLTAPANMTVGACQTQAQVNSAFATWLAGVQASGGCGLSLSNGNPTAPSACGGSVMVTWTASSSCEADKTASATFTVTGAPAVNLTCPQNVTLAAGQTPEQIANAYAQWLASASASGGCNLQLTNNSSGIPACGQTATVTWTATSTCGETKTCSASFTVPACEVFQGCTPGYWKNHPQAWGCGYTTESMFFTVFNGITNKQGLSPDLKLGQAVDLGGGNYNALSRHAVAALLNACHNNVKYPYTQAQIKSVVAQMFNNKNATVTLGNSTFKGVEALKNEFDRANNLGCPLNNSNYMPTVSTATLEVSPQVFTALKVAAYPNPYSDVVKFTIESDVSGNAQLELVNMLGQRVAVVYNGFVEANTARVIEYRMPATVPENVIYALNIGGKRVTGKLFRVHRP
ncbi:MAG TPA: hypothetical protein VGN63_10890 [Flavisolibacter sp.]|nr:hypothetical protein [Flavisolibacter sp.]